MDSCYSLEFGGFLSFAACSLGGVGSGGLSHIFGIWYPSAFPSYMGCGGRWDFFPSSPSLFVSVFYQSDEE